MAAECEIEIRQQQLGAIIVVSPVGVLDSANYLTLRAALVKAAAEQPSAVLVELDELDVPAPSALAVLTSAQWMVSTWPAVPICAVTANPATQATLVTNGITRYVAVFASRDAAIAAIAEGSPQRCRRRRVARDLPRHRASQALAREILRRTLSGWSCPQYLQSAEAIAVELIRNVLDHTQSAPRLRLELQDGLLTVAVADDNPDPVVRQEPVGGTLRFSGLGVVSTLSRVWGCHPSTSGKVVWAVIGPTDIDS